MANITPASKTTIPFQASDTLQFSKPSGLEVGDLLVAVCFYHEDSTSAPSDFTAPAGWTQDPGNVISGTGSNRGQVQIFRKTATSTETAASTLDFTATGADKTSGELYRVTGFRSSDPIGGFDIDSNNADLTNATFALSFTPDQQNTLYFLAYVIKGKGATTAVSAPVIDTTPNPTWTQQFSEEPESSSLMQIYTAVASATDAITQLTQTVTDGSALTDWGVVLIAINDDGNASGENNLVTTTSTVFSQSGIADCIGSNSLVTTTTVVNSQGGNSTSPTQWSNESKPSTTWTNET